MRLFLVLIAGLMANVAYAQQQPPTLFEQALSSKLTHEINESLACSASLIAAQRDLEAAKARIKELETASAPK